MSTAATLTRFARTPTSRAVWKSIAAARMCSPSDVRFRSSTSSTRHTAAVTMATIAIFRISTSPTDTGRLSSASDAAVFPSGPNQRSAMLWSRNATAKVAISITAGDCVRSGRKTTRSIASESARTTSEAERDPDGDGPPALGGEGEREPTGHDQLAVGEVDESKHAEDEADADGHQGEDRAEPDRVHLHLEIHRVAEEVGETAREHGHER